MTTTLSSSRSHHPLETAHAWALGLFVFILPIPGTVALRLSLLVVLLGSTLWLQKIGYWQRRQWIGLSYILPWVVACLLGVYWATQRGYALGELKTEVGYGLLAFWLGLQAIQHSYQRTALGMGIGINWMLNLIIAAYVIKRHGSWEILLVASKTGQTANMVSYWLMTLPILLWISILDYLSLASVQKQLWIKWGFILAATSTLIIVSNQRIGLPILLMFIFIGTVWVYFLQTGKVLAKKYWVGVLGITSGVLAIAIHIQIQLRWGSWETALTQVLHDPRLDFWRVLIQKLMEQPLHGFGFGRETMKMALLELVRFKDSLWHPHNLFIAYWLYAGLFGLIAILWLFVGFFVYCWRACRLALAHHNQAAATTAFAAGGLLLAVALRNLTNDMWVRDNSLLFWLLLGCLLGYLQKQTNITQPAPESHEPLRNAESNVR